MMKFSSEIAFDKFSLEKLFWRISKIHRKTSAMVVFLTSAKLQAPGYGTPVSFLDKKGIN